MLQAALPRLLLTLCWSLLLLVFTSNITHAQAEFDPSAAAEELDRLQSSLSAEIIDAETLTNIRDIAITIRSQTTACAEELEPEVSKLTTELELLGDITDSVDVEIWESRNQTLETYNRLVAESTGCELTAARANRVIDNVEVRFKAISAELLSTRGANLIDIFKLAPLEILTWSSAFNSALVPSFSDEIDPGLAIWGVFTALILGAITGWYFRRRYRQGILKEAQKQGIYTHTVYFLTPLFKRVPLIFAAIGMTLALVAISSSPFYQALPIRFSIGLMVYGFGLFLIEWCTGPSSPVWHASNTKKERLRPLRRRFRYLIFALLTSIVVLGPFWLGSEASNKFPLLRLIAVLGTVVPLYMILGTASKYSWLAGRFRAIRAIAFITLTTTVAAEIFGYHNFCNFMLRGFILSTLALFVLWVLLWQTSVLIDWLNKSEQPLAKTFRALLGFSDEKRRPGVGLYQLVVDTSVWLGFIFALIFIWDNSGTVLNNL
ncbi:MAG: hypothetical protein P8R04_01030, partial [Gammaproteobacteria bacterium]|nr:hypothetical protein [Gammaproteobacteria bacterium]